MSDKCVKCQNIEGRLNYEGNGTQILCTHPVITPISLECTKFIHFKKFNKLAATPKKATEFSAGYDLFACEEKIISPRTQELIDTGICFELPKNSYGRICGRSSLALKNIWVFEGTVDEDFTSQSIKVIVRNFGELPYKVDLHAKMCQIVIEKIYQGHLLREVEELKKTTRVGGFGSSNLNPDRL